MIVTVITVVLNDIYNIEKTIRSVIGQPVDIEYIVIDGGSTDGTLDIIEKYKDKISYFISETDGGIADAFNKGLSAATGDVVGILNSGDTYADGALAHVCESGDDWDVLYGDVRFLGGGYDFVFKPDHTLMGSFMSIAHPGVFVKKSLYDRFGIFDTAYRYAMDYELILRFFVSNAKFVYAGRLYADMLMGGASDVHWLRAYFESFIIKRKYYGLFSPFSFFIYSSIKRTVRNILSNKKTEWIVKYYRKKLSPIKKLTDLDDNASQC